MTLLRTRAEIDQEPRTMPFEVRRPPCKTKPRREYPYVVEACPFPIADNRQKQFQCGGVTYKVVSGGTSPRCVVCEHRGSFIE